MPSDNFELGTYARAMELGSPFIRLKLDTNQPIEMGVFVGAFTAIAAEYNHHAHADLKRPGDATLFVKDVRDGCIEADLIPYVIGGLIGVVGVLASINTIDEFVERYCSRLAQYKKTGGRAENATKAELKHFTDQVAAIANAPGSQPKAHA